jgi:hypothetical protein
MVALLSRDLFKTVHCETAEKLLNELTPHASGELWKRHDNMLWLFRGQREAAWALTPAARRPDAFLPFNPIVRETPPFDEDGSTQEEARLVGRFASFAGTVRKFV